MYRLIALLKYLINKLRNVVRKFDAINFNLFYNTGIDAYNKKDYQKAITLFKLAIEQREIKPQVYYNLALCYQDLGNFDRAIVNYNKFLGLVPEDYDGLYNSALVYYNKGNYAKAIEIFEKCISIKNNDEDCIKSLVLSYLKSNEIQKAIDFANNILENSKNGLNFYYTIAKIFEDKNSNRKDFTYIDIAMEMYSKIIEKNTKHFDAYLSISICYAKKGELGNSVDFCQKALEINPQSYEANSQMGVLYYCCEEVEESIKYYEKALAINPNSDFKIYSSLGYAYEKIHQNKKAIDIFNTLLKKFPACPSGDEIKNHIRILKTL